MRSRLVLGLLGMGLVSVAAAAGCGGGGETATGGSGGGTGGGATTSSSGTITTTVTSSSTSSSGNTGGGGNHSFDTAAPMAVGDLVDGDLYPTGAVDYYSFPGKAGQAVTIFTQAQGSSSPFDPVWVDTVVTLYDANQKQIAENNDAIPRRSGDSELITVLPADGTYYVKVQECWSWAGAPASTCLGVADKDATNYSLGIVEMDPTQDGTVKDEEKGNDATNATAMTYAMASSGYYLSVLYGTYTSATDVDVYSLTLPSDYVTVTAGARALVEFWVLPPGKSADGSTTPVGKVYLVDPADPTKHVAEVNGPDHKDEIFMWPPVDLSKEYWLFVEHPATAAGTNDFYVALHGGGVSNPVEVDDTANDTPAGAESPQDEPDADGHHYYVDGDIGNGAADVDYWKVPVGAATQIAVACSAQRGGSGLRGFKAIVADPGDGMSAPTPLYQAVESATSDAGTAYLDIPAGVTNLLVKMSAASQDPNVTSSFYHCGIHLR